MAAQVSNKHHLLRQDRKIECDCMDLCYTVSLTSQRRHHVLALRDVSCAFAPLALRILNFWPRLVFDDTFKNVIF